MLDVCLLGTSGMLPLPGRWLTSLMTRYNGSSLMIDCGEGTQIAVKQKGWSFNPIDVICFTHYHADHISGLPGLLLTIGNSCLLYTSHIRRFLKRHRHSDMQKEIQRLMLKVTMHAEK